MLLLCENIVDLRSFRVATASLGSPLYLVSTLQSCLPCCLLLHCLQTKLPAWLAPRAAGNLACAHQHALAVLH